MDVAGADWTAIGSIAGGFGTVAAFLAIMVTIAVYFFQNRGEKAAAVRQNLQFLHGQQIQVVPSIAAGLLAIIDRQIREFRERLGPETTPGYFLEELFGHGQPARDRFLFRASALDSNLSGTTYSRLGDGWDGLTAKAFEFRGALRIFAYACEILTKECRLLCDPEFTISILAMLEERGERRALSLIPDLDHLVNTLLSDQIELAERQFEGFYKDRIGQGCYFIGMLADVTLQLSDPDLLRFSRRQAQPPEQGDLEARPYETMSAMLDHLAPKLSKHDVSALREVLRRWFPPPAGELPSRAVAAG